MIRINEESEYKHQESSASFDAGLDNAINQLSQFILAQSAKHQINALIRLESEIMQMQTHAIQLLSQEDKGRLAEACELAEKVFEGNGAKWLFSPSWALGGQAPVELFNSKEGIQTVFDTLGRIQWGVYS